MQCKHCGTWVADEGQHEFKTFPTLFDFVDRNEHPILPDYYEPSARVFCTTNVLEYTLSSPTPRFVDGQCSVPASVGDFLLHLAPPLNGRGHKGGAGRIGVLGGSVDYAGAPFYAGMASLRVGAELLYLLTAHEATGPIKSYSPELMVSGVYHTDLIENEATFQKEVHEMVTRVEGKLSRMHALIIGPGLGRSPHVLEAVALIIELAKKMELPLVVDADGLWLINQRPELVRGYSNAVLTPNVMEYKRLCEAVSKCKTTMSLAELCDALDGPVVIKKGKVDEIGSPGELEPLCCDAEGFPSFFTSFSMITAP
jgi:ATP-dependent NAD(P)H-hydrate dehydratase